MSYAVIRNVKYKMSNLPSIGRHNERKNENYGNKDIDVTKSNENYHFKAPIMKSYEKEFYRLREEYNLKGNLRITGKKQSNVACEFIITSDKQFFDSIGKEKTKQFFKDSYEFACKKCGEKNIMSAVVHMDEHTPHMHLVYIPVVKGKNKKGEEIEKINCSQFWKGFNSYGILQDGFYKHCREKGYDLQRGEVREESREHLTVEEYKIKVKAEELAEKQKELDKLQSIDINVNLKAERKKLTYSIQEVNAIQEQNRALKLKVYNLKESIKQANQNIKKGNTTIAKLKEERENLKNIEKAYNDLKNEKEHWENFKKANPNIEKALVNYNKMVDFAYKTQNKLSDLKNMYIKKTTEIAETLEVSSITMKNIEEKKSSLVELSSLENKINDNRNEIMLLRGQIADLSVLNFKRKKQLQDKLKELIENENKLKNELVKKFTIPSSEIVNLRNKMSLKIDQLEIYKQQTINKIKTFEKEQEKIKLEFKQYKVYSEIILPKELLNIANRKYKEIKSSTIIERELMSLSKAEKDKIYNNSTEAIKQKLLEHWKKDTNKVNKSFEKSIKHDVER